MFIGCGMRRKKIKQTEKRELPSEPQTANEYPLAWAWWRIGCINAPHQTDFHTLCSHRVCVQRVHILLSVFILLLLCFLVYVERICSMVMEWLIRVMTRSCSIHDLTVGTHTHSCICECVLNHAVISLCVSCFYLSWLSSSWGSVATCLVMHSTGQCGTLFQATTSRSTAQKPHEHPICTTQFIMVKLWCTAGLDSTNQPL